MPDAEAILKMRIRIELVLEQLVNLADDLPTTPQLTDADNAIMYLRHLARSFGGSDDKRN